MSKIYVFSDPHFHHENMAKHRGFSSAHEMNELIVSNWNKTVLKRDTVWILGDITMEKKDYEILSRLNGNLFVILGNHDMPNHVPELLKYVKKVCSYFKYKNYILSHIPVHESELNRFKGNIHGHLHEGDVDQFLGFDNDSEPLHIKDSRYINVCAEKINYTPIEINKLINE